jgi:predicted ATPase
MVDQHQLHALIAKVIAESLNREGERVSPEEAKQTSKCIVEALESAGFELVLKSQ